jgi:hypothetical protein
LVIVDYSMESELADDGVWWRPSVCSIFTVINNTFSFAFHNLCQCSLDLYVFENLVVLFLVLPRDFRSRSHEFHLSCCDPGFVFTFTAEWNSEVKTCYKSLFLYFSELEVIYHPSTRPHLSGCSRALSSDTHNTCQLVMIMSLSLNVVNIAVILKSLLSFSYAETWSSPFSTANLSVRGCVSLLITAHERAWVWRV